MKIGVNFVTEEIVFAFPIEEREMSKLVLQDTILRYKEAGFDVSNAVAVLCAIEERNVSLQ